MIIGKGNQQAIVRFSTRATDALMDYLKVAMQRLMEPHGFPYPHYRYLHGMIEVQVKK